MNNVNKTLYIPLYGKAYVSQKGLFLDDKKAEEIWTAEGFSLKGKAKSKWLAYYMGIRSAVFDSWVKEKMNSMSDAVVIHIGCGMDSRVLRVGADGREWYDVDFAEVIAERKRYFTETESYKMIAADAVACDWSKIAEGKTSAIVVMEGVSMYLSTDELKALTEKLSQGFEHVAMLMDCYSLFAAKMSRYKNPVKEVGVSVVYGLDDPTLIDSGDFKFLAEHEMTPEEYVDKLEGFEKKLFKKLYAGKFAKKLYKLYEYGKN